MDLLLISRCPPFPIYHGDRLIPFHLARELSSRRCQIDLLAFYDRPEDLAEVPRYEQYFHEVVLIREPRRTPRQYWYRNVNPGSRFPRRAEESWSPEMWRAIQRRIQERPYDLVHVFGGIQVYEYWRLVNQLPNIIVPYESYSLWLERAIQQENRLLPRLIKRFQSRMSRSFESWMFDQYERTVVLTNKDADMLKTLNPRTATATIPNGVDVDYFTSTGHEPDEPVLLFTGNYDYAPNLDAALRLVRTIFPRVKAAVPNARLYLVGGNPPPELLAYASESVEIPGRVPDLRSYFEYSLIFVSPLRLGAGIKNKVLEALAMETNVVATPLSCDGIPVLSGQHVLLGITDDDLVNAIFRLFKDATLRRQLRQNGRQLIEQQFTWRRVTDMYEALYHNVIQARRNQISIPTRNQT
ncbi:MAG: glycosyltransferase [Anaerolineae bacterium]|nr:glycosyltransferase [Anaerolineae bacterium]